MTYKCITSDWLTALSVTAIKPIQLPERLREKERDTQREGERERDTESLNERETKRGGVGERNTERGSRRERGVTYFDIGHTNHRYKLEGHVGNAVHYFPLSGNSPQPSGFQPLGS